MPAALIALGLVVHLAVAAPSAHDWLRRADRCADDGGAPATS